MPSQQAYVVHAVPPSDSFADTQPVCYPLSDVEAIASPIHVISYLYFPVLDTFNAERFVEGLRTGLSHTLAQLPLLAGRMFLDGDQHPYVARHASDTCGLGVRYLDESFPSFDALQTDHFPLSMVRGFDLLPPRAEPSSVPSAEVGVTCCSLQVNFFRGGILLASSLHHKVADAWSGGRFWSLLAENTKAASAGSTSKPQRSVVVDMDRSRFKRSNQYGHPSNAERHIVREYLPSLSRPLEEENLEAALARATRPEDVVGVLLHIPSDKATALKKECAPQPPEFVSTFDCISALLFRAVTRARLQTGRIRPEEDTGSVHAVNVRMRSAEPCETYFGNAVVMSGMVPVSAAGVLSKDGLQRAAVASRRGTDCTTTHRLQSFAGACLQVGMARARELMIAFRVTGVVRTSWQQIPFATYDFGFGPPSAFRSPGVVSDGAIIIFPTLAGEGIVAWIGSRIDCIESMKKDPELLTYAQVLGLAKP